MISSTKNTSDHNHYYWIVLVMLFLVSLITGFYGFQSYFFCQNSVFDWTKSLYCTLQLFVLEGGDLSRPIPFELDISRFLAPFTAIMAIILTIIEIFKEQWNRLLIRLMKNHVIIIGLGTKGKNILEECLNKKEKVLIIERNIFNRNLESIRTYGCRILIGDANNETILKEAKITKAKSVFLLMGDDTQQVNVCLLIYKLIKESKRNEHNALSCIMHLHSYEYLNTLKAHKLVKDPHDGFVLNIFNVYENSARELFENYPPDLSGISMDSKNFVQMLIMGFGKSGEALALQTALTGHYINGIKPKAVILDRLAELKVEDFIKRYPTFKDYCEINPFEIEASSPELISTSINLFNVPNAFTSVVLCFDNKTQNLLLGLQLENIKLKGLEEHIQIFVRTSNNESFAPLTENIKPYGLPSKVCSQEVIIDGQLDIKAKAIHNNYLKKRKSASDFPLPDIDSVWENLPQEYKDSNRKAADHMGIKIRAIDCKIADNDDDGRAIEFTQSEIESLAKLEHRRWSAERSLAGWKFSIEKNNSARQSPYLTDWENLSEEIKEYDRDAVKKIPEILSLIGKKIVKKIV